MYLGLYTLGGTIQVAIPITVLDIPLDPSGGNPTYRIYEADTLIGAGSLTPLDVGTITGATNATPIEITSVNHNLQTGNVVTITNVGGNVDANGTFIITKTGDDTFTLDGSVGVSDYTSGGSWHVTGLYLLTLDIVQGSGFDIGTTYQVRIDFNDSGNAYAKTAYFSVT